MSRASILKRISQNRPDAISLPVIPTFETEGKKRLKETFIEGMESVGGKVISLPPNQTLAELISSHFPKAKRIEYADTEVTPLSRNELENIDVAVLQGSIGVAENGAIWVAEQALPHRALPFICEHLVLVLEENELLENMHTAYKAIRPRESGFGVFIAGPSKTADIEQSLVVGAHGARSLLCVFI